MEHLHLCEKCANAYYCTCGFWDDEQCKSELGFVLCDECEINEEEEEEEEEEDKENAAKQ